MTENEVSHNQTLFGEGDVFRAKDGGEEKGSQIVDGN